MPLADGDRSRLTSKIEQYDEDNHRRYDHRRNPRSESPPSRYNREGRRSRVSPSYRPYSCHHRNPRYEDDIYHTNNKSKNEFSDSDDDEELKGLSYSEYRRLKRQKLRKKLKNCIWRVTPSPPRNEGDQSEPLDDSEEDDGKPDDDLVKKHKHESSDEDTDSGSRKRKRGKRSYSDDESDEDSSSDSYDDSDDSRGRKSSRKKKSRRSRNDTEENSEESRSRKRRSRRKRSYSVGASEDNSSSDSSDDSDDCRKRKTSRRKKSRKSKNVDDDSESSDHSLSDRRRKHSRKKRSRKSKTDSDGEVSDDSASDRKKRYSRKRRSRKSSSRRKSSRGSRRRSRKSRKPSSGSSGESDKEKDESMSDVNLAPKMKKSPRKADTAITSDSEINDDSKKQETDTKKVELDPEALAFKELLESQKKNKAEETDTIVGPVPLPKAEGHISYGGALRPGEGDAIAQYVQQGKRIPRRGEVGLSADEIQKFESLGYVMSGSRHQRMNAIRIRKENQVYSAEDKRALAMFNYEEKAKREHKVMADLQRLVQRHIGQDTGPAHDPFGKDSGAADA